MVEKSWEEKKSKILDSFLVLFWNGTFFILSGFFDPAKLKPKFTFLYLLYKHPPWCSCLSTVWPTALQEVFNSVYQGIYSYYFETNFIIHPQTTDLLTEGFYTINHIQAKVNKQRQTKWEISSSVNSSRKWSHDKKEKVTFWRKEPFSNMITNN